MVLLLSKWTTDVFEQDVQFDYSLPLTVELVDSGDQSEHRTGRLEIRWKRDTHEGVHLDLHPIASHW